MVLSGIYCIASRRNVAKGEWPHWSPGPAVEYLIGGQLPRFEAWPSLPAALASSGACDRRRNLPSESVVLLYVAIRYIDVHTFDLCRGLPINSCGTVLRYGPATNTLAIGIRFK